MTEFAAGPAFYCLCLAWREIREEREASASAINCCRRCWAMVRGLAGDKDGLSFAVSPAAPSHLST